MFDFEIVDSCKGDFTKNYNDCYNAPRILEALNIENHNGSRQSAT